MSKLALLALPLLGAGSIQKICSITQSLIGCPVDGLRNQFLLHPG